jgi:hypothetical protein
MHYSQTPEDQHLRLKKERSQGHQHWFLVRLAELVKLEEQQQRLEAS